MVQISVENSKQIWNILSEGVTKILPPFPLLSKDEELRDIDHLMKIGNLILCVSSVSFHIWFIMTVYYKMRQLLYHKMRQTFITKYVRIFTRKYNSYYKLQQFYYKMWQLLQNTAFITNCDSAITAGGRTSLKLQSFLLTEFWKTVWM